MLFKSHQYIFLLFILCVLLVLLAVAVAFAILSVSFFSFDNSFNRSLFQNWLYSVFSLCILSLDFLSLWGMSTSKPPPPGIYFVPFIVIISESNIFFQIELTSHSFILSINPFSPAFWASSFFLLVRFICILSTVKPAEWTSIFTILKFQLFETKYLMREYFVI